TDQWPHWPSKSIAGVSPNRIFVRRDSIVSEATVPEMEGMFRQKNARFGPQILQEPLTVGFARSEYMGSRWEVLARIQNITTEPIFGVWTIWDVRSAQNPRWFRRDRHRTGGTLLPNETLEDVYTHAKFFVGEEMLDPQNLQTYWFDLTVHVHYLDRAGNIQRIKETIQIGG